MKKTYLPFLFVIAALLMSSSFTQAQVVINEISYNSPESGNDSLEYIEILNAGSTPVDIGGWHFSAGIEDTFPSIVLGAGEYYVTAVSAQAMLNVFGISVQQWSGGALSNSGELIKLVDRDGFLVDSVLYDDADPWPVEPDGNGPSLELKDAATDNNDAANWQFSGGTTGVIINGFEVSGTPGAENSGGGTAGPAVNISLANFEFTPKDAVVKIGDVVRWTNPDPVAHNVNGTQATYPSNPESFTSGGPNQGIWEYDYIPLTAGFYNYRCNPHFSMGMVGTLSVYDPSTYTDFPLSRLRMVNANGSALYDGVPTTVTAVVHGVNFQPTGYSFYIVDANNVGINVFSFDPGTYTVQQGDLVKVYGVIDQFNGQLEIIPDSIEVLSTGNALVSPREVSNLTETDEGSYLHAFDLAVDSVSNISAMGYTVYTTHNNGSKVQIRVDADANIPYQPEDFNVGAWVYTYGLGTQFDSSFPFTSGYQILAVELFDVVDAVPQLSKEAITMNPNPATNRIQLSSELNIQSIEIYTMDGRRLMIETIGETQTNLDVSGLPAGLHIVKALTSEGVWTSALSVVR